MQQYGSTDIYFDKYAEHVSYMKPSLLLQNLIYGGTYIDLEGDLTALNHTTGERCDIKFFKKEGST